MPISKNESRRKRRSGGGDNISVDFLSEEIPKRPKVHAQRKFAQGSALFSSPILTPFKEIEKEKSKSTDSAPTELLPSKRPNTEDFLTFLCFRGTSILPPSLDFFNIASQHANKKVDKKEKIDKTAESSSTVTATTTAATKQNPDRPFIAFGVRKRADPFVNKRIDSKRHHSIAVHALRRKYQNQKLAKIRAIAVSKINENADTVMRTRSSSNKVDTLIKKPKKKMITTNTKRSLVLKRNMCLRSGNKNGKVIPTKIKTRKLRSQSINVSKRKSETSSEYSSDDNEPLVKTVKPVKKQIRNTVKRTLHIESTKNVKKPMLKVPPVLAGRCTRSNSFTPSKCQRPTRKTKEAAALYMEMLGRKLSVLENDVDDDTMSIDSFPELPNVKRAVQRENEIKAQNKNGKRISTRNNRDNKIVSNKIKKPSKIAEQNVRMTRNQKIFELKKKLQPKKQLTKNEIVDRPKRSIKPQIQNRTSMRLRKFDKNFKNRDIKKKPIELIKKHQILKSKMQLRTKAKNIAKTTSSTETSTKKADIFNESDEEPLSSIIKPNEKHTKSVDMIKRKPKIDIKDNKSHSSDKEVKDPDKSHLVSEKKEIVKSQDRKVKIEKRNDIKELITKEEFIKTEVKSENVKVEQDLKKNKNENTSQELVDIKKDIKKIKSESAIETKKIGKKIIEILSDDSDNEKLATKALKNLKEEKNDEKIVNKNNDNKDVNKVSKNISENLNKSCDSIILLSDDDDKPILEIKKSLNTDDNKKILKEKVNIKKVDKIVKEKEDKLKTNKKDEILKSKKSTENISNEENQKKQLDKNKTSVASVSDEDCRIVLKEAQDAKIQDDLIEILSDENTSTKELIKNKNDELISNRDGYDFLCKDIGRRFGKGKVNMSAEQIEKWLNHADQELKKESKSNETIFKFEEKSLYNNELEKSNSNISSEENRNIVTPEKRSIFNQRRIITKNKERKEKIPSATAFSPDNESSVYAFEETEMPVSTPFRRHSRRPSSTTTSKSEEDTTKLSFDDDVKKPVASKFRIPTMFRHDDIKNNSTNQQVSLTLGPDDASNQCASIAVQVDITGNENVGISSDLECSTTTAEMVDDSDGHLFYIPLQTSKQSSSDQQVIQGVAVKLGTAGPNGPNQRVIMQAKLVTKSSKSNQQSVFGNKPLLPAQNRSTSMYPPVGTVQPFRSKPAEAVKPIMKSEFRPSSDHSLSSDDMKLDRFKSIPTSPSASSSSSANKKTLKARSRQVDSPLPIISTNFPSHLSAASMVEAPTFHPTEKEFQDPLEYIDKIRPLAENFGLCRIVPPPGFKPECKVSDDMRFTAYNQYVHKMLYRYGPNFREMIAIKKYLATQNIVLNQAPWIGGMEVDLPRLYQTVQSLGGLKEVIEKKKWPRVAEIMRIPKSAQDRLTKLDDIYCKYLLPYDTLSDTERENLLIQVDLDWENRQKKLNNEQIQTKDDTDGGSSDGDNESDDGEDTECIVRGRSMALSAFYRIARNTMAMWFKTNDPSVTEVEQEFWKHVNSRINHLCVHSGSIDSGGYGYGFVCSKNSPFARHPWNLKVLTNNAGSILRSMGPIMGVTVPTLHVGMVFSACCWYRDPHGLPWIEYLHTGANKVWYGIPESMNTNFRQALNKLVPNVCRKTPVWLPSDTAMVPPSLLVSNNVSLSRTVQEPGQYIVIFPNAFTSSLCTGYTVSESVFFAQTSWLENSEKIFTELKESCEPSMFSLERLLLSMATDSRCSVDILKRILPGVQNIRDKESVGRDKLRQLGLTLNERLPQSSKKKRKADTDGEYLCEVCKSNLYVSLVTEMQDDEVFCLQHAAEFISSSKIPTKECKLMYTYTEDELVKIVDDVINSIDTKSQKKSARATL